MCAGPGFLSSSSSQYNGGRLEKIRIIRIATTFRTTTTSVCIIIIMARLAPRSFLSIITVRISLVRLDRHHFFNPDYKVCEELKAATVGFSLLGQGQYMRLVI